MDAPSDLELATDAILLLEEPDALIAAWTLGELDHLADLGSIRSAWADGHDWSA
jgi:hypothetical protein